MFMEKHRRTTLVSCWSLPLNLNYREVTFMKFYLKGTFVNVVVSFINVDNFERRTNLEVATSKVFSLMAFYIFIFIFWVFFFYF